MQTVPPEIKDLIPDEFSAQASIDFTNAQLKFSASIERRFRSFYHQNSLFLMRSTLIAFTIGYVLFGVTDHWSLPFNRNAAWLVRYGVTLPCLSLAIYLSFSRYFARMAAWVISFAYLAAGLGIVGLIVVASPQENGYHFAFSGLIFPILAVHLSCTRIIHATATGWLIWLAYGLVVIIDRGGSMAMLFGNLFYLGSMNLAGMLTSYLLDRSARIDFLQRRLLAYERRRSESLLLNVLPHKIATSLKERRCTIAQEYPIASILFADIVNFTPLSAGLTPTQLVELLDEIFSKFDDLVERYNLEKIKTIGDCYMVASGVPSPRADHATALVDLAIDMLAYIHDFSQKCDHPISLRIGIHSGSVVAGVIGRKKFLYDLWGDTVNTASRMESHGKPGVIQITTATYQLVRSEFDCAFQGEIMVKGKGEMPIWHVLQRNLGSV